MVGRGMRIFALIVLIAGVAHGAPLRGAGREAFVRLMEAGHPRWEIPAHAGTPAFSATVIPG